MTEETIRKLDQNLYEVAVALDRMNKTIYELRQELAAAVPKAVDEGPVKLLLEKELAKRQEKELVHRALQQRIDSGVGSAE